MANLFFVQNTLTFFGLTFVKLPQIGGYFCINPYYNRKEDKRRSLAETIKILFPFLEEIKGILEYKPSMR